MTRRANGWPASPLARSSTIARSPIGSTIRWSRVMAGKPRVLRRARGYAPAPIALPPGFEAAPPLLAMGGELKATFCLVKDGEAILSQHQGDLENAETFDDYRRTLALYAKLFDHSARRARRRPASGISLDQARPRARGLATGRADRGPASSRPCRRLPGREPLSPRRARPCSASSSTVSVGATTERSGAGSSCSRTIAPTERLGLFKPVAMLGGAQAAREPWRNLYAHLMAEMGWAEFAMNFAELELFADLARRPRATLDAMSRNGDQRAESLVLRPAVRRRRRGAGRLPRPAGL